MAGVVRAHEIVVREVQANRSLEVFQLLAETVRQASKSAHAHSHGQVLALDQACRNMNRIGATCDNSSLHMRDLRRDVASRTCRFGVVKFNSLLSGSKATKVH